MKLWITLAVAGLLALSMSTAVAGRGGGFGGGGRGGGGGGAGGGGRGGPGGGGQNWWQQWNQNNNNNNNNTNTTKPDPKQVEAKTQQQVEDLVKEGYAALKAGDPATALEKFLDALQLKPHCPEALLGVGLVRAANKDWFNSQSSLELAVNFKANPHTLTLDQAAVAARQNNKGRAMYLLNKYLVEDTKGVDEMVLNALIAVVNSLDDAQKQSIASLPTCKKTIESKQLLVASQHAGQERWGLAWKDADEVAKLRAAKEKEPFPADLPFLLPDDSVLPFKGQPALANDLVPGGSSVTVVRANPTSNPAVAIKTPDPKPPVTSGNGGSGTTVTVVKPPVVAIADPKPDPKPDPQPDPKPVYRTVTARGAAFAVAPNLLITCDRLVHSATSIEVQKVDGGSAVATVINSDPETGLALLKVTGESFVPMGLSATFKPGQVGIAAFTRPAVFQPELQLVQGELSGTGAKAVLKMSIHPRSAGSPVVDAGGEVMAVISATRDESPDKLSVISLDAIKAFAVGKFTPLADTAGEPGKCVAEIHVTRRTVE